jgi:hypothetical protein
VGGQSPLSAPWDNASWKFGDKFQAAWRPPVTINLGAKNFAFEGHLGDLYFVLIYHLIRVIKAVFAIGCAWFLIPENYLYNNFLYHILLI